MDFVYQVALDALEEKQGGVCVVMDGKVTAMVPLPIAGLLSDKRVHEVADEVKALKLEWRQAAPSPLWASTSSRCRSSRISG
ncbi:hypothetical protein LPU83_pLPU83b_0271 (plasmid) [Rhizobium favelukesii]|uniref:Adenine deaminase C-terminal domain-containing protein n=1 Tax=Rhizobium favelukesii TaxID=348824 RepID=W6S1B9_9HYPH|nr:hypothetical protein LPU83_pLPU83b_0271 [Rhizobium favelukesii]